MTLDDLRRLAEAERAAAAATRAAIVAMADDGTHSLREIARVAGVSHTSVQRIVAAARAS